MNNKKLALEVVIVPACVMYLIFMLLKNTTVAYILFTVCAVMAALWFSPKYFGDLYTNKGKIKPLSLVLAILDILLALVAILHLILKLKITKIIFIALAILVLIQLIYFTLINIKDLLKKKKDYGINILYSFGAFFLFAVMVSTLIIYIK